MDSVLLRQYSDLVLRQINDPLAHIRHQPMAPDTSPPSSDGFRVYQADSRHLAETLAGHFEPSELDGLVDATVTSPPYADIKDYGYDEQIGNGDSYDQYLDDLREVFKNVYEVTADDGSLWVNINNRQKGGRVVDIKAHIIEAAENLENVQHCEKCGDRLRRNGETGELYCVNIDSHDDSEEFRYDPSSESWTCHTEIIWNKLKSNHERDGVRNVFEYVLVFKKTDAFSTNDDARIYDPSELKQWWISDTYNYSPKGATYPNVWDIPAEMTGGWGDDDLDHDAVFPAALVERMIEMATDPGDVVLDPFAGSGTTPAVGKLMDRRTIGFELNPKYIDLHDSRYESIKNDWEAGHMSLTERKERYAQATWALRHHGYIKWLFTTLRSQIGDVASPHDLWEALAAADVSEALTEPDGSLAEALAEMEASATPLTAFLKAGEMTDSQLRDLTGRTTDTKLYEQRIKNRDALMEQVVAASDGSPVAIVAAMLEKLSEADTVTFKSLADWLAPLNDEATAEQVRASVGEEAYRDAAGVLLNTTGLTDLITTVIERVPEDVISNYVRELDAATQATLGEWGSQDDGPEREHVLASALLVAIASSAHLASETAVERFEPLLETYRTHGNRFGVHAAVLQPKTTTGTPPDGEDRAPVTQTFLFATQQAAADCAEALDTAVKYLLEETPSSNARKLAKHGLDVEMEWLSAEQFAERVENDDLAWETDEFYLYEPTQHERYRTAFDGDGRLWEMCTLNPSAWEEKYCSRSAPAIISPLALAISEAEPEKPKYQIDHINKFGEQVQTKSDVDNSTLF